MGPTGLLPFWRKVCWGFFRPEKSDDLQSLSSIATPGYWKDEVVPLHANKTFKGNTNIAPCSPSQNTSERIFSQIPWSLCHREKDPKYSLTWRGWVDHSFPGCMEARNISSLSWIRTTDPWKPLASFSCKSGFLLVYLKLGNRVKH
jgi:hypothetical protein